ncbi:MAG TPA: pitrilysin family protein [Rhodanobacter sp.]|nr:pitrilysin family protein [Rhodanobacter sp.]
MKMMSRLNSRLLFALVGTVALAGGLPSVHAASAPAAVMQASQDNVTRATLANGLRVVIVRDTLAPMVTTQITYLTGGYQSPVAAPGTGHALEHMMFRDSKGLTGVQLRKMTGKMGARNNAFTTEDATQYYFLAPSQYVDMLLHIESLRMRGAQLTDKGWSLERGAIEQEVSRNVSNPATLAYAEARQQLFAGTGYAHTALGSRATFDKTSSVDLRAFYDRWYQPNNAILVIVGDVDAQAVLAKVKQLFGDIPRGNVPKKAPLNLRPVKPVTIARTTPAATGGVRLMYRAPGRRSPDYAAMRVLVQALNNARSKFSALEASGKLMSVGVGMQAFSDSGIGSIGASFPKGGDSAEAVAELDHVLDDILAQGVSKELVATVQRKEKASFEFDKNDPANLASTWSDVLAWAGLNSPQEALDRILAVTPADVDRVAHKYFGTDRRITLVLTPSTDGKRPSDSKGFGGTETFASDDTEDAPLPEWARKQLANLQMPHWTLDPVTMRLDNGITLIVQPETISKTVVVRGQVDNNPDLQAPTGQKGIEWLLDGLFSYGTQALDRAAFHKALDDIAASGSAGRKFALQVPSEHFDRGMQLLAANMLRPRLPAEAFKVKQQSLAQSLKGQLDSPNYKMKRALYEGLLPAGDPDLRQATAEKMNSLTLKDVKDYYAKVFRPDMTTIVVVGDVTPEQAKAQVEKWFGGWKATGPKPNVVFAPVPANGASQKMVKNPYASQDKVYLAQLLAGMDSSNPDRYALQLGNQVLGGNGFASRLMQDIRVKHGYAYGARSNVQFDRSRTYFFVSYGSDADKVKPVNDLIYENIKRMRTTLVSDEDLLDAKQASIRSIPLRVASVGDIAGALLHWSVEGEPLDKPIVAARHYLDMTPEQVRAAYQKYIKPENMVQVVMGPVPEDYPEEH